MTVHKRVIDVGVSLLALLLAAACTPQGVGLPVTGETSTPGTPAVSPGVPPQAVLEMQ